MPALLRTIVVVAAFVAGIPQALAEIDVVVLGPATSGTVSPARVKSVKAIIDKLGVGTSDPRAIEAACAADPGCLTKIGTELTAHRVLALTIGEPSKGQITLTIALVDVIGKEMVAVRDLTLGDRQLAKDLTAAVKKFLDEAPTDRAKALFAEGNQHFNLGEMEQALELYKRAYRIKPLPAFQFNIAQCHRKLGHFQEAINMYQAYLVNAPDAATKQTVESLIAESKTGLAEQTKRNQEKAVLDAKVATERMATEKTKAEEARKAKEADAVAQAERLKIEQARMTHDERTLNKHPTRKWMFVTAVLGAGAAATGGYFGVQSAKLQKSYDDLGCGDLVKAPLLDFDQLATCKRDSSSAHRDQALGYAFLIGGGAALLASALVFAIDPGNVSRETPRVSLHVSPTSFQAVVSW
jgi:tetratricopeptide (TPR) repeat protein